MSYWNRFNKTKTGDSLTEKNNQINKFQTQSEKPNLSKITHNIMGGNTDLNDVKFSICIDGEVNYNINLKRKETSVFFEVSQCVTSWKAEVNFEEAGNIHKVLAINDNIEELFSNFVQLFEAKQVTLSRGDNILYIQFTQSTFINKQVQYRIALEKAEIDLQQVVEELSQTVSRANTRIKDLEIEIERLKKPSLQFALKTFSNILKQNEIQMVQEWVSFNKTASHLQIVLRGSVDGFAASTFQDRCDGKANLICFVESTNKRRFGGYIFPKYQKNVENYVPQDENNCFIFSLDNKVKYKSNEQKNSYAYFSQSSYGFTLGSGHDLYLANDCKNNKNSYSNLPSSYGRNEGANNSSLAGGQNFQVSELEIYEVIFQD